MTIYVDDMRACTPTRNWKYASSCHMIADSIDELHIFAGKIGLRRSWFQNGRLPHYDLTVKRRIIALKRGAIPIDRRDFVARMRAAQGWK